MSWAKRGYVFLSGLLALSTLNATGNAPSAPSAAAAPQMQENPAPNQGPVRWEVVNQLPEAPRKVVIAMARQVYADSFRTYGALVLGMNQAILDAVQKGMTPQNEEVKAFYLWLKSNQNVDLGLSQDLTHSLRTIATIYNPIDSVLNANRSNISIIPPYLEALDHITLIYFTMNQIRDIGPLAGLTNLKVLNLNNNQISDIRPLAGLTNLVSLELNNNQISDIRPLVGLTELDYLSVIGNQINDLRPLASLTHLKKVYLSRNKIQDVEPLGVLRNLKEISLMMNPATDTAEKRTSILRFFSPRVSIKFSYDTSQIVHGTKNVEH